MKFKLFLVCALLGALSSLARSETVIKILHIQSNPKILAIWQEAAQKFESAHPGCKVQFDYLENEAFKAKLPTLLQSKDLPSAFHSWGGGVMYEQVSRAFVRRLPSKSPRVALRIPFIPPPFKTSRWEARFTACRTTSHRSFFGTIRSCARKPEWTQRNSKLGTILSMQSKSVKPPASLRRRRAATTNGHCIFTLLC